MGHPLAFDNYRRKKRARHEFSIILLQSSLTYQKRKLRYQRKTQRNQHRMQAREGCDEKEVFFSLL